LLSPGTAKILEQLFSAEDFVSIDQLADFTNSSKRSIRYHLQKIDGFLIKNGLPPLERHNRFGARLSRDPGTRELVHKYLQTQNPYTRILSRDEIHLFILMSLLVHQKELPVSFFETTLNVSRTAILNHLGEIGEDLEKKGFRMVWKKWAGIRLDGDENARILELSNLFCSACNIVDFYHFLELGERPDGFSGLLFRHLFNKENLPIIKNLIFSLEKELDCTYDDWSFITVFLYFVRLLNRLESPDQLSIPSSMAINPNHRLYPVAKKILDRVGQIFPHLTIDESETGRLISLISGMKTVSTYQRFSDEHLRFTDQLIMGIESIYGIQFGDRTEELKKLLVQHVGPMMNRIRFNIRMENPLFDEILSKHGELFQHVREICHSILDEYGLTINDHEISYLTLYFASTLEKLDQNPAQPRLLVACVEGMAISRYIASTIQNLFPIRHIDTMPIREISNTVLQEYDFLITTVDIPHGDPKKVIKVHNVIGKEDIELLKNKLNLVYNRQAENHVVKVERLIQVIRESCEIKDIYKLQYDLLLELLNEEKDFSDTPRRKPGIHFSKNHILLGENASDWKEAVRKGARILEENGDVLDIYGKKIIANLEQYGPYMSIAPKVMLAHAGPEDGVMNNSLSVVTFKKGIQFHDRFHVPVQLIMTLALKDPGEYIHVTETLIKLAKNPNLIGRIIHIHSKAEVFAIFSRAIEH